MPGLTYRRRSLPATGECRSTRLPQTCAVTKPDRRAAACTLPFELWRASPYLTRSEREYAHCPCWLVGRTLPRGGRMERVPTHVKVSPSRPSLFWNVLRLRHGPWPLRPASAQEASDFLPPGRVGMAESRALLPAFRPAARALFGVATLDRPPRHDPRASEVLA